MRICIAGLFVSLICLGGCKMDELYMKDSFTKQMENEYQEKLNAIESVDYQKEMLSVDVDDSYLIQDVYSVELFGNPSFGKTHLMKLYLEMKNIPYQFRDIANYGFRQLALQTGGTIPFVIFNRSSQPYYAGTLVELMKVVNKSLK